MMATAKHIETEKGIIEAAIYSRVGELLQLQFDEKRILISGPRSPGLHTKVILNASHQKKIPPEHSKAARAASLFFQNHPVSGPMPGVEIYSNIPRGKGFSSSSADILCILYALNEYYQAKMDNSQIYEIAAQIDATDPLLNKGMVLFDSASGKTLESLDEAGLCAVYFDALPNKINVTDLKKPLPMAPNAREILFNALEGWKTKNYPLLFTAFRESALWNQKTNPKPCFEEIYEFSKQTETGIFTAHTGTLLGIVFKPQQETEVKQKLHRLHIKAEKTEPF